MVCPQPCWLSCQEICCFLTCSFTAFIVTCIVHTGNGWNVKYLASNAVVHDQSDGAVFHILNYLIHGLYV